MTTSDAARLHDTRAAWDAIAPAYDRTNTPTQMAIAEEGLRRAGVGAGTRFLDIACGSGALAIPAARRGARVVAVDLSPVMLDLLRERARREQLDIQTAVMDGHALEVDDASFDVAGSQFGVMLMPDLARALREMARVVVPGGRVLLDVYGDPARIDFLSLFVAAVRAVRPAFSGPPTDPPPDEFRLADPARLRRELAAAGLRDIRIETVEESAEFETGRALWDWIAGSNPIVECMLAMLEITGDERALIERALERLVRERAGGNRTAVLRNPVHIAVATR